MINAKQFSPLRTHVKSALQAHYFQVSAPATVSKTELETNIQLAAGAAAAKKQESLFWP